MASKPVGGARGALIVFEGIDRCGKTTQCSRLAEYLRKAGVDAVMWRFPDRTTDIGQTINDYLANHANLDDSVVHLLFVANRFEKRAEMLQLLNSGTTLVVDRYSYSGVAYSSAKELPLLGPDYCRSVEVGLPAADLVVYMDISPEASAARGGYGGERYEKMEFQRKVVSQFKALQDDSWAVINACHDIEAIHNQVIAVTEPVVARAAAGQLPLRQLWTRAGATASRASCDLDARSLFSDGESGVDAKVMLKRIAGSMQPNKQLPIERIADVITQDAVS